MKADESTKWYCSADYLWGRPGATATAFSQPPCHLVKCWKFLAFADFKFLAQLVKFLGLPLLKREWWLWTVITMWKRLTHTVMVEIVFKDRLRGRWPPSNREGRLPFYLSRSSIRLRSTFACGTVRVYLPLFHDSTNIVRGSRSSQPGRNITAKRGLHWLR